jgi:hypothetical protein
MFLWLWDFGTQNRRVTGELLKFCHVSLSLLLWWVTVHIDPVVLRHWYSIALSLSVAVMGLCCGRCLLTFVRHCYSIESYRCCGGWLPPVPSQKSSFHVFEAKNLNLMIPTQFHAIKIQIVENSFQEIFNPLFLEWWRLQWNCMTQLVRLLYATFRVMG